MTATDRQSFLTRIARNPDDDTDRLVFADWLDENGDPDRASCIRGSIIVSHHNPTLNHEYRDEWRWAGVCPTCGGTGHSCLTLGRTRGPCSQCWDGDVGGLLCRFTYSESDFTALVERVKVEFRRGFPYRVYCRLGDVCEVRWPAGNPVNSKHLPTPWALAVVGHHPVTEFFVSLPFNYDTDNAWHKNTIPPFLFQRIEGHDSSTPDAAHTAMARVLGSWVREHLPPETT